jgi:hypothetical protein
MITAAISLVSRASRADLDAEALVAAGRFKTLVSCDFVILLAIYNSFSLIAFIIYNVIFIQYHKYSFLSIVSFLICPIFFPLF